MKKSLVLVLYFFASTLFLLAQSANKNMIKECVLLEVFTGVDCGYCPGAAAAVHQMMEEGLAVVPIEYHTNTMSIPQFYTLENNARSVAYNITSYPTSIFDGMSFHNGGELYPGNIYNSIIDYYNQRINISSPFMIDVTCNHVSESNYQVNATVKQLGVCDTNNLRIMIAYTQSNIEYAWQGMSTLDYVCRDLIPNENGTTYLGGDTTITEYFNINDYPIIDLNLVVWVQDFNTKEVFQAVTIPIGTPEYTLDIGVLNIDDVALSSCSGKVAPVITVKNNGSETIESFDIVAKANEVEVFRTTWSDKPFSYNQKVLINVPEFIINSTEENILELSLENPNGQTDLNTNNNSKSINIKPSPICNDYIKLVFKTDDHPEESSVIIENLTTGEIEQELIFEQANNVYNKNIRIADHSCYKLTINDDGGNGISSYFSVRDKNNQILLNGDPSVNSFTEKIAVEFHSEGQTDVSSNCTDNIIAFPNPANNQITVTGSNIEQIVLFDIVGNLILSTNETVINTEGFKPGVYKLKIQNNKGSIVYKSIVVQ